MARHNEIYVKAWCASDNLLGWLYQVRKTELSGICGRCFLTKSQLSISQKREVILRLASMLFVLLSFAIDKDRSSERKILPASFPFTYQRIITAVSFYFLFLFNIFVR